MNAKAQGTNLGPRDPLLGGFANSRDNPHRALCALKSERTYKQVKQLIGQLRVYHVEHRIYRTEDIQDWNSILRHPGLSQSKNWIQEFGWLVHGFLAGAEVINDFFQARKRFGRAYLLGDYQAAEGALQDVQSKFGCSLWLAERQLMLRQSDAGFEGHKEYLAQLQKSIQEPLTRYLVTMLSKRLEPHVTHESFSTSMQKELSGLRRDGQHLLAALIEIAVSPWTFGWKSTCQEMLFWCLGRPLIDRYNVAIKVLSLAPLEQLAPHLRENLIRMVDDLHAAIPDPQLTHLRWALSEENINLSLHEDTEKYLSAYDCLVTGRFEECVSLAESLLMTDPASFDYCWLLAKGLACSGTARIAIAKDCIAFRIVDTLQQIAENRVDLNVPLEGLRTLALQLGDNHLGISLWQFAQRESDFSDQDACRYAFIKSKIHSPESVEERDYDYRKASLSYLSSRYPGHPSLEFYLYRHNVQAGGTTLSPLISKGFSEMANAERAAARHDHLEVLKQLEPILAGSDAELKAGFLHAGKAASLQFDALLALDRPIDASQAVTAYYVTNSNILRHVPFERLIEGAKSGKWECLRNSLYWPILVFLNDGEVQDVYEAVDDFLISARLTDPLDILKLLDDYPQPVTRVLLRDVVSQKVLSRGALWAKTPEDQRQVRTKLLQTLYSKSFVDQEFVVNELSELEQARILEAAYRNVEGPKFFLDFADVNRALAGLLQGTFERYLAYKSYEEKGGQLAVEADLLAHAKAGSAAKLPAEKRTENSEVLLSNIATVAFWEYLWNSQHGINSTLSTRIRHGSLENQIKRVFGAHSILAIKDLDGEYQCDEAVKSRVQQCSAEDRTVVLDAYIEFTRQLNALYQSLVTQKLRIRLPASIWALLESDGLPVKELGNEEGLLDFGDLFTDLVTARLKTIQFSTIVALLTELQRLFAQHAEECFRSVRTYFDNHVATEITNLLLQLDEAVKAVKDSAQRASLRNDILAAKNGFSNDLRIVRNWFSSTRKAEIGINSVKQVITTTARVVNFASNDKLGQLVEGYIDDHVVDPDQAMVLYEVLSILFRNVVQHSGIETGQEIEYRYQVHPDGKRLLSLSNKMGSVDLCSSAVLHATTLVEQPSDPRALQRSPGGTGLARIKALLVQVSSGPIVFQINQIDEGRRFYIRIDF